MTAPADGSPTPFFGREPEDPAQPSPVSAPPAPDHAHATTEVHAPLAANSSDNCPSCGSPLAADQRYCLVCGHRRGDPRLPFMDAVVFMEAINQPQTPAPPPPPSGSRSRGISANASLIAGIATLVLAIGVGVLIGRSGDNENSVANTPQVITVPAGGGTGETELTPGKVEKANKGGGQSKAAGKANNATAKKAEAKSEQGSSGQSKAAEEVLEPKVPQAKPEAKLGEGCVKGTAGCSDNGKFEGEFFGE